MKSFFTVVCYLSELKAILATVNRQVWSIDPLYVAYSWIAEATSYLTSIAPFIFVVVGIGYVVETSEPSWNVVMWGIGIFAAYICVKSVVESWAHERRSIFDNLLSTHLKLLYVQHFTMLDLGRLVDPVFIKLARMAENRGRSSVRMLWESQKDLVGATVGVMVSIVALLTLDWVIGVLAIFMAAPTIAKRWFSEHKRRELDEMETLVHRQRNEVHDAIADPRVAVLTRLLKLTKHFFGRYSELTDVLKLNICILARFQRNWDLFVSLTMLVCVIVFGLYFSSRLVARHYSFTEIGVIIGSLRLITNAIQEFGWSFGRLGQERKDYQYLEDFFQTRPMVDESGCKPIVLTSAPTLELDGVEFAYPGQIKKVIEQLSLVIHPGQKVAFVGPNGCGKTTLLRLIARVYASSQGIILADQYDLAKVLQESWLEHTVMVTQAATLSGMEMVRAITGSELAKADQCRLAKALEFAGADAIVSELELGLNTWIGEEWPDGKGFSTGERQRLVLAAAFYRLLESDVFIALFDEPTANCDAETKARFYQAIAEAPEFSGKTVLVSLHDPLYLQFFDRVIQLDSGKVVNDLQGKDEIEAYRYNIGLALAKDL